MAKRDYRKGALSFDFVAFPRAILTGAEWRQLPHAARVLAMDLAAQFTGKNNGRLTPSYEALRRNGWAKATLARAKTALLGASFVVQTRKGHPPRTAEWVGFTWWRLDYEKSMDIDPRTFPHLNFQTLDAARIDPNPGRERAKAKHFLSPQNETDRPPKPPRSPLKTRAMTPSIDPPSPSKRDRSTEVNGENSIGLEMRDVLDIAISPPKDSESLNHNGDRIAPVRVISDDPVAAAALVEDAAAAHGWPADKLALWRRHAVDFPEATLRALTISRANPVKANGATRFTPGVQLASPPKAPEAARVTNEKRRRAQRSHSATHSASLSDGEPEPKSPQPPTKMRVSRLPSDFRLPAEWRQYCAETRPDLDPEVVFVRFIERPNKTPGRQMGSAAWEAQWKTWVKFHGKSASPGRRQA